IALRKAVYARGLRYRVHLRLIPGVRREADIVFSFSRVAVFVDGCFWHSCPIHGSVPRGNRSWWKAKLLRNQERDAETEAMLTELGWVVIRVWEHEDPVEAAERIEK